MQEGRHIVVQRSAYIRVEKKDGDYRLRCI